MNLIYVWLLVSYKIIFIVKGEILKDVDLLSTSEKDINHSKLNLETIPCYRKIKRRSFWGMGCKGHNVVTGIGNPQPKKKTSTSSSTNKNDKVQETRGPIPVSSQQFDQVQPPTRFEEDVSHTFFQAEQGPRTRTRNRPPRPPRPSKPKSSTNQPEGTTTIDSKPHKLSETEVQKESSKEPDHEEILPIPEPPSPSPWVIRLKKYQTTAAEFMQELKKSFRAIVLDHGDPEMDRMRDKITSFFERFWIWVKSIPKTYRSIFHQSNPLANLESFEFPDLITKLSSNLTYDNILQVAIFRRESEVLSPEKIQKDIDSYLNLQKLFSVGRTNELLRQRVIEYLSDSNAGHVKRRLEYDPELLGLTVPELSRALLIQTLAMTIKDPNETEKDRLDSTLLLKFIDSLGKSPYARFKIEKINQNLIDDPFKEKFEAVTPDLSYLNWKLGEKQRIRSSLDQRESMDLGIGSVRFNGIHQVDHLGSSSRRHQ
ncbi:uncharacterized protein MELLADRAFT_109973 [Melampsora larici-populina 98AG31]|uniref:Secreted protein n=1 Tax=Melampsora larici-populina (strain 98AG31 / pathotype 3-4-7) TaxID=747676 RepID=F4RY84_MELLP|nr:uncharacterized protein MELLADRAFT_109973 [Melampsora larici-populina 98AG31]EGG02633.1 hypothetical protein MELLADRAFT_109973 [Melampsora larici-populina 98AG31]